MECNDIHVTPAQSISPDHQRSITMAPCEFLREAPDGQVLVPPHIPFTVSIVFPPVTDDPTIEPRVPQFEIIKSCWPVEPDILSKAASVSEFTRYIVEELCCKNPLFVNHVLAMKFRTETWEDWNQRVTNDTAKASFLYGSSGSGHNINKYLTSDVSVVPLTKFNDSVASQQDDDFESWKANPIHFSLTDANIYPDSPLPPHDNGYDVISCHYKLLNMLRREPRKCGPQLDEGVNLLLRVSTGDTPVRDPYLSGCVSKNSSYRADCVERRTIYFTYTFTRRDPRGWSRKQIDRPEPSPRPKIRLAGVPSSPLSSQINVRNPIPFEVELVLPQNIQNKTGVIHTAFETVKSTWFDGARLPFSTTTVSEFIRHIVEDFFCNHPAFVVAVVSAKINNETQQTFKQRQRYSSVRVSFSYGTVGVGQKRRSLKTVIMGNIFKHLNDTTAASNKKNRRDDKRQVNINFILSDANCHPEIPLPSQSNASDILLCHTKASPPKNEVSTKSSTPWGEPIKLLLRIDSKQANYEVYPIISGVKRKIDYEIENNIESDLIMELSYTKKYKSPNKTKKGHQQRSSSKPLTVNKVSVIKTDAVSKIEEMPDLAKQPFSSASETYSSLDPVTSCGEVRHDLAADILLSFGNK